MQRRRSGDLGMIDLRRHHIPEGYAPLERESATIWMSPTERNDPVTSKVASLIEQAVGSVTTLLAFHPRRAIHAVIYASTHDAHEALGRRVPPSFLMAPLHTRETAVIVAHSPRIDPRNGDRERMLRHLCHEVSHVVAAERTGSTKRLGDGNTRMRMRPWVDEGFAVCVAAQAAGQPEALERVLGRNDAVALSMDEIDQELCALHSSRRSEAFAAATARVWAAVQRQGYEFVFAHLDRPERWT